MSSELQSDVCYLAWVAPSGECLRGEGLEWLIGAVVFASCSRGSNCPLARAMDGLICAAALLALANQLPLPRLLRAAELQQPKHLKPV